MYVLGPLLKELLQHIGPQAQVFLSSPALQQQLINSLMKIPSPLILVTAKAAGELPKEVSDWYNSLSAEERKRINNAITWVAKDLSGYAAKELTGLPIDKFISEYVGTGLAATLVKTETYSPPTEEVAYIESGLLRGLKLGERVSDFSPKIAGMTAADAVKLL